jgi:hypothetical protein
LKICCSLILQFQCIIIKRISIFRRSCFCSFDFTWSAVALTFQFFFKSFRNVLDSALIDRNIVLSAIQCFIVHDFNDIYSVLKLVYTCFWLWPKFRSSWEIVTSARSSICRWLRTISRCSWAFNFKNANFLLSAVCSRSSSWSHFPSCAYASSGIKLGPFRSVTISFCHCKLVKLVSSLILLAIVVHQWIIESSLSQRCLVLFIIKILNINLLLWLIWPHFDYLKFIWLVKFQKVIFS